MTEQVNKPSEPTRWSFLRRNAGREEKPYDQLSFWEKIQYLIRKLLVCLELVTDKGFETFPYAIFVPLSELPPSTGKDLIVDYLKKYSKYDELHGFEERLKKRDIQIKGINEWLNQGLILPVFDGFDNLDSKSQASFISALKDFMSVYNKCGPFVLTARKTNLRTTEFHNLNMSLWEIQPFNHLQIMHYLEKAVKNTPKNDRLSNKDKVAELWKSIVLVAERNPQMWTIIATPLTLGMLVYILLYKNGIKLVGKWDRRTIYAHYFNWLWIRADTKSELPDRTLAKLAYQSFKEGKTAFSLADKEDRRLIDLFFKDTGGGSYSFLYASFQSYFAASYFFQSKDEDEDEASFYVVSRGIFRDFSSPSLMAQNGIPNLHQSQEVLIFLAEWFSDDLNVFPDFIGDIVKELYEPKYPLSSKILLLRLIGSFCPENNRNDHAQVPGWFVEKQGSALLNIMKKIGREDASEEKLAGQSVQWLMEFLKASAETPDWQVGFAETGYGLSNLAWERLETAADESNKSSERRLALHVMACLHHVRSASCVVEHASQDIHFIPEVALKELLRMGFLIVNVLVDKYDKAENEKLLQSQLNLVRLMKYVVPSRELSERLNKAIVNYPNNNRLAKEAVLALSGNENFNNAGNQLISYFRIADQNICPVLVEALTEVRLNEKDQEKLMALVGSWDRLVDQNRLLQRDMAIEVLQRKFNSENENAQATDFEILIDQKLRFFKPDGIGRKLLGFMLKHKLNRLHDRMRKSYKPRKEFLDSLLDVCAGLDTDKSKAWVTLLLKDRSQEVRQKALDTFCKIYRRQKHGQEMVKDILGKESDYPVEVIYSLKRRVESDLACRPQ